MKKITVILSALAFCGSALAGKLGPASMTNSYPAAQDRFYLGLHADLTQRLQQRRLDNTPYENTPGQMGFKQGGFQVGMLFGAVRAELSLDYGTYGTDIVLQSYFSLEI